MVSRPRLRALLAKPMTLALVVIAATAALYLPWLGYTDLVHEETRRAVIARTMMETGDYLVPYLADVVYLSKPPLFNWLIAAASWPGGTVTELTARLPSVVALAALALVMVATAGRHLSLSARWLLGLGLLVTGELMHKAVLGNIDVVFALLVSASLWTWYALDERGHRGLRLWLPPAVLIAAGFLAKREPALVFYYLGIGAFLLSQGRFKELFRPPHLLAAATTVGVILIYLVPTVLRAGPSRYLDNFYEQVVTRGVSPALSDYVDHIALYPLELFVAALPLSVLLIPLLWPRVRRLARERHGRMLAFCVLVVLVNLPVYWFRADAAVRHFSAMFPTLVVISAIVFDTFVHHAERWPRPAKRTLLGAGGFLLALATALAGAMVVLTIPGAFPEVAGPILPAPLTALIGALGVVGLGYTAVRHWRRLQVFTLVALLGFGSAFRVGEMTYRIPYEAERIQRENDDVPAIVDAIRSTLPPDVDRVQAVTTMPHALWFYDRNDLVVPAVHYTRDGEPASPYVIGWTNYREDFESIEPEVTIVREFPYEDGDFILGRIAESQPRGAE